jgi:hypothetical protein
MIPESQRAITATVITESSIIVECAKKLARRDGGRASLN